MREEQKTLKYVGALSIEDSTLNQIHLLKTFTDQQSQLEQRLGQKIDKINSYHTVYDQENINQIFHLSLIMGTFLWMYHLTK